MEKMGKNVVHQKYTVSGMFCENCAHRIEKKLCSMEGVVCAWVDFSTAILDVWYESDAVSAAELVGAVDALGYGMKEGVSAPDTARGAALAAAVLALYVLLSRTGLLNAFAPARMADNSMGYAALFVTGLITSLHCVAMCGGINLSQSLPRGSGESRLSHLRAPLMYNIGRVASYTVVGGVLGLAGTFLGGNGLSFTAQGCVKIVAGALMVLMGLNMLRIVPGLGKILPHIPHAVAARFAARARKSGPLFVGLLNGFMPCGPLQTMQLVALGSGSVLTGAASMFAFGLGTVPLMLGLGAAVAALGRRFTRAVLTVGAVAVTVLGFALVSQGTALTGFMSQNALTVLVAVVCALCALSRFTFKALALQYAAIAAVACAVFFVAGRASVAPVATPQQTAQSGQPARPRVAGCCGDGGSTTRAALPSCCSPRTAQAPRVFDRDLSGNDEIQIVRSTLGPGSYPSIEVRAGIPVRWVISAPEGSLNLCNYAMIAPTLGFKYVFAEGQNILEFTPMRPGTHQYTCWMGMIIGQIRVLEA